jgi:CO/xanthine dehydrogenase Mo-binding subunit
VNPPSTEWAVPVAYARHRVSLDGGPIVTSEGVTIETLPLAEFEDAAIDTIVVPGALDVEWSPLSNRRLVDWLAVNARKARSVPGIPTAFWRSPGPSHNVFVTESFMDELAAAAKQDAVAYRRALLDKSPRAKAVLELAAEKAGWGQSLPERVGRGVSLQFVFGTYMA